MLIADSKQLHKMQANQSISPWMPTQLETILGHDIQVVSLSEIKRKEVEIDLVDTGDVGLSIICKNDKGLNDSAIVVCLTTRRYIYVIDPRIPGHFQFLVSQFQGRDITFYSVDGRWDAYTLANQFNIKLEGRHFDLVAMDLYLTLHGNNVTGVLGRENKLFLSFFTSELKREPLKFEQLCAKYLDLTRVDLMITEEDKMSLELYPYDTLARNTIKKKAGLMWVLTEAIVRAHYATKHLPSKMIFSMATTSVDLREDYQRSGDKSYANLCAVLDLYSPEQI